jgi:hypothetical protein
MRRHTATSSDVVVIGCIAAGVTKSNAIEESVVQVHRMWQAPPGSKNGAIGRESWA